MSAEIAQGFLGMTTALSRKADMLATLAQDPEYACFVPKADTHHLT